jgi:hypothetical protein
MGTRVSVSAYCIFQAKRMLSFGSPIPTCKRSRVSNFMNKFRDLGFISYNGNIEVHSSLLNVLLNDRPQLRRDEAIDAE